MPSFGSVVSGLVIGGVIIGGGGVAYSAMTSGPGSDRATVVRVIDGDTIDVRYDDGEHRVRLLNIDTPETKHPGKAVECLGPEATSYLADQLLPGDVVRLEYDVERHDRYDRELAGVFEDDVLINAEIARRGLGIPVLFEPNRKFLDEVTAAYEEAKAAGAGMFSADLTCTFEARIQAYADSVAAVEALAASEDPPAVQEAADSVVAEGVALLALIDGAEAGSLDAAGLTVAELDVLRGEVISLQGRAESVTEAAVAEAERVKAEEEAERKAEEEAERKAAEEAKKAEEEAERKAAEEAQRQAEAEAARQAEAERRAQEEAAAAEAQRRAQQPPVAPQPQPAPQPSRPGAGYTGCRAYIGGPYMDDQGRFYTPIDCVTKAPLVP